jgi:hypothetical protein
MISWGSGLEYDDGIETADDGVVLATDGTGDAAAEVSSELAASEVRSIPVALAAVDGPPAVEASG